MCRNVLLATVLCLCGWLALSPQCRAGGAKRSVEALVADLKKGDAERSKALQELEAMGEKAAAAVPALIELLPGKNEDVRLAATLVLGKIGAAAVEPLSKAIGSKDADVRFYAVWGLAFVGPAAKSATPEVLKALGDSAAQVRRKAAYTLGRIDPDPETAVGPLVTALGDLDDDVRQAAEESLPKMGKAAVPVLIKAVQGDNAKLRNTAIKALGEIGAAAAAAIPELKTHLLQPDKGAAESAANALAGMGAPALPVLTAAAMDDNPRVRAFAVGALQKIAAPAVPALVDLLGAKHTDVRRQAAALLGQVQVQDKSVVIALGFATRDKDYEVRRNALQSLHNMGSGAKLAEPYVSALLVDFDPQLRLLAFHTLTNLGVDARPGLKKALGNSDPVVRINTASLMTQLNLEVGLAEPILLEGLKEKDQALKTQAAHALSLRGLQADVVLPIFIASLKAELPSVRRQAAESIVRYGTKAKEAAPALIAALDDPDDGVRHMAIGALRQVGAEPKALFAAMVKVLRGKDTVLHEPAAQVVFQVGPEAVGEIAAMLKTEDAPALRLTCLQTLAMVGPPARDAVTELTKALGDPAPRARMTAARALGNIGPDAKTALAALARAAKDEDGNVKQVAQAAIVQIQADPKQQEFQVQGALTPGDPFDRVRGGCYHVVHTYRMKAGRQYTIDLTSPWDNYLRLENSAGQQLAQDDDSGGMLNARIVYSAPADGWYRIIVTSFGQKATGNYTLPSALMESDTLAAMENPSARAARRPSIRRPPVLVRCALTCLVGVLVWIPCEVLVGLFFLGLDVRLWEYHITPWLEKITSPAGWLVVLVVVGTNCSLYLLWEEWARVAGWRRWHYRALYLAVLGPINEVVWNELIRWSCGTPLYLYTLMPTFNGSGSYLSPLYYLTLLSGFWVDERVPGTLTFRRRCGPCCTD